MIKTTIASLVLLAISGNALAQTRGLPMVDGSLMPLFIQAIDAPDGKAPETDLRGPFARRVLERINAPQSTRMTGSIETLASFTEPGCRRLALRLRTPDYRMPTTDGRELPFDGTFQLNICRDGSPPRSSPKPFVAREQQ